MPSCCGNCATAAIDAALMAVPEGAPDIESEALFEDDIYFAAPAGSRYASLQEIDLGACAGERFVSLSEGFVTYSGFMEAFRVAGFKPDVVMTTGDIFSLMNLVAGGVGYTLLPGRVRGVLRRQGAADPAAGQVPDAPDHRAQLPAHARARPQPAGPAGGVPDLAQPNSLR